MRNGSTKTVLTTGEVAKICSVAPRTVSKWFDTGQLQGYRIPGSKDRRIPMDQLVRFMKSHGIPTDGLSLGAPMVLLLDSDSDLANVCCEALTADHQYETLRTGSPFEAGILVEKHRPAVIVVDVSLFEAGPSDLVNVLRRRERLAGTKLIATGGGITQGQSQSLMQAGYAGFLQKPFEARELKNLLDSLLSPG